jgi:hypothetical protein
MGTATGEKAEMDTTTTDGRPISLQEAGSGFSVRA